MEEDINDHKNGNETMIVDLSFLKTWPIRHIALLLNLGIAVQADDLVDHLLTSHPELQSDFVIDFRLKNIKNLAIPWYGEKIYFQCHDIFSSILMPTLDVTIKHRLGPTLLILSLFHKQYRFLKFLLKQNIVCCMDLRNPEKVYSPWIEAIYQNDLDRVKTMIQQSNQENIMMKGLSSQEIEINPGYDRYDFTPLITAYLLNRTSMVEFMIDYFDVDELDVYGYGLLHYAILKEDVTMISNLIHDYQAKVNYRENYRGFGHLPLDMAIQIENMEICNLIMSPANGFSIDDLNKEGSTSLLTLLRIPSSSFTKPPFKPKLLKRLIKEGANVNASDRLDIHALEYTFYEPNQSISSSLSAPLLKHGAIRTSISSSSDEE